MGLFHFNLFYFLVAFIYKLVYNKINKGIDGTNEKV